MANNKKEIYSILGVNPQIKSNHSYGSHTYCEKNFVDDPKAPSGSIFDNYSNYPEDSQNYWQYFRFLTILGIVTVLAVVLYLIWDPASPSRYKYAERDYENEYVEDYEPVETPAKERLTTVPSTLPQTLYFTGEVNNLYPVTMRLDTRSRRGEYYYNKVGSSAGNMRLNIQDIQKIDGKYYFRINEFNSRGNYCGYWEGFYEDGKFSGEGVYLSKKMPFELHSTSSAYF